MSAALHSLHCLASGNAGGGGGGGGDGDGGHQWGAYLTNWTYTLLTVYVLWHLLATILFYALAWFRPRSSSAGLLRCGRPSEGFHESLFQELDSFDLYEEIVVEDANSLKGDDMSSSSDSTRPEWYLCVLWMLYSAVSSGAVMVTGVYFTLLFPDSDQNLGVDDMQVHLLNSCVVLLEHAISAAPYRLLHVLYPMVYGLTYIVFNLIYWSTDNRIVVYSILDWNKPGLVAGSIVGVGFVLLPLLHGFFFLIYKARMNMYRRNL